MITQAFFSGQTSFNRGNDICPYHPSKTHLVCWWFRGRRYAYLNKMKKKNSLLTFKKI